MSHDGIPFIGSYCVFRPYWHVATGFKKWGMTSSMLSAMIIRDRICGLPNPYEELFRPQRFLLRASAKSLAADLLESTAGLAKVRFTSPFGPGRFQRGTAGLCGSALSVTPAIGMKQAGSTGYPRAALIWAASWSGTGLIRPGTVPATAPGSTATGT